jgi:hypothetical protein
VAAAILLPAIFRVLAAERFFFAVADGLDVLGRDPALGKTWGQTGRSPVLAFWPGPTQTRFWLERDFPRRGQPHPRSLRVMHVLDNTPPKLTQYHPDIVHNYSINSLTE